MEIFIFFSFSQITLHLMLFLLNYIKSSRGSSRELPVRNRNEAVTSIFSPWENLWGLPIDRNYLKLHLSFLWSLLLQIVHINSSFEQMEWTSCFCFADPNVSQWHCLPNMDSWLYNNIPIKNAKTLTFPSLLLLHQCDGTMVFFWEVHCSLCTYEGLSGMRNGI